MEKNMRELTKQELFDVGGGAEHIQTENIVSSVGGDYGPGPGILVDLIGAGIGLLKPHR